MKVINNDLIRSFGPCYDPSARGIPDGETLPVNEWADKYRNIVPVGDIFWLLLRIEFYDNRQIRLFSVWCTREALKLLDNPDKKSINACDVAERFANGEATAIELDIARQEAWKVAARAAGTSRTYYAAMAAYCATHPFMDQVTMSAPIYAAKAHNDEKTKHRQLNYLLTFEQL